MSLKVESSGGTGGANGLPTTTPPGPGRAQIVYNIAASSLSSAAASASEWRAVKTVRNSTIWSWITWPFRAFGSLLGGIWSRLSSAIWGSPTPVSKEVKDVKIKFPGYFSETVKKTSPEIALRKGWLTLDEVMQQQEKGFTMDQAKIQGWVQVDIPGRVWGSSKMLLKDAIEGGYITVEQAITAGAITEDLAKQATWIKKQ